MKTDTPKWAERLCPSCNEKFSPKHSTQIHCGAECALQDARELKAIKAALAEKRTGKFTVHSAPAVACPACRVRKIRPGYACRCGYCPAEKAPLTPFTPALPPEPVVIPPPPPPPDTREYRTFRGGHTYVKSHVALLLKEGWRILPGSGEYDAKGQAVTLYRERETRKC